MSSKEAFLSGHLVIVLTMAKLEIRVSDEELEGLRAAAGDEPVSSYVRGKLGLPPATRGRPVRLPEVEHFDYVNVATTPEGALRIAEFRCPRGCEGFSPARGGVQCPSCGRRSVAV